MPPAVVPVLPIPFNNTAIQMVRGKHRRFRFQVVDRSLLPALVGLDISAYSNIRFMAKINASDLDAAAVVSKSLLTSGVTLLTPTQGLVQVDIAEADTGSLADVRQSFFAEIQAVDAAAFAWPLWQGGLDVLPTAILAST